MKKTNASKLHTLKNAGFTLVELVVSMTLTAIFATAIVAIMPSATRIYMQVEDMSRAQVVADMVVDALREECANTYIEDFASVRIYNATPNPAPTVTDLSAIAASGVDDDMLTALANYTADSAASGNVLIIRKSSGYCEAISSCIAISESNYRSVKIDDKAYVFSMANGVSSRAVYRFFASVPAEKGETITYSEEIRQGYVHYGYYQCGRKDRQVTEGSNTGKTISCIFPAIRYDYTAPFSSSAYNGYTVDLQFSNLDYVLAPGETADDLYTRRPISVQVTVKVYPCNYSDQASTSPIYTRTAILTFEEDTTK